MLILHVFREVIKITGDRENRHRTNRAHGTVLTGAKAADGCSAERERLVAPAADDGQDDCDEEQHNRHHEEGKVRSHQIYNRKSAVRKRK